MTNLTIIVKEETTTVMEIDLTQPINAKDLANLLGQTETTVEKDKRLSREFNEKRAKNREIFENYLITEINLALLQGQTFSEKFYRYNKFDLERYDINDICSKIAKKFKKLGYYVDDYEYSYNNWYDYYRISVKL